MAFNDFMNKVRHWDNLVAKWIMRHFYFMFFQFVLMIIFLFWFVNMFNVIDVSVDTATTSNNIERILSTQTINTTLIVILMLLNSFWLLYIFNAMQRMMYSLRDISYNTSWLRRRKNPPNP